MSEREEDREGQMQVEVDGVTEWRNIDHFRMDDWRMRSVPTMRSTERCMTTIDGRSIIYRVFE